MKLRFARILQMRLENGLAELTLGSPRSAVLTNPPHPPAGSATPRTPRSKAYRRGFILWFITGIVGQAAAKMDYGKKGV
ncbi:MAG: hypothetical protein PVF83_04750 [Anaerolineales bacterium]